jgi:hypothetical protein
MLWLLRLLCPLTALALIISCVWAQTQQPLWDSLFAIAAMPWGAVTLGDLASGLIIVGLWMYFLERHRAWWWIVLLPLVGNIATLAWLTWRAWHYSNCSHVLLGDNHSGTHKS